MKIRRGFVSNSSSESFIVRYGQDTDENEFTFSEVVSAMKLLIDFYNKFFGEYYTKKCGMDYSFSTKDYRIFFADDSYEKEMVEGWEYGESGKISGRIVIESTLDNSIPSDLFILIGERFEAVWFHLG